ncbi:MAG: histidine phosphatase family protein [Actinobacteria bacterium]|nr:histidine phosphatase family protein [Actinomycetota bacterium]
MELVLVRHGLPARAAFAGDDDHRHEHGGHANPSPLPTTAGAADPGLSPRGVDEALKIAAWLKEEPITAIYSSPLRRARETAAPLVDALGLPLTIVDGLAEWDRDVEVYVHVEDLQARDDPVWHALAQSDLAAVGVDQRAFETRVVEAFDAIAAAHRSQVVAVVCHGGVINAYTAHVAGLDRLLWFAPDYGGISRVRASSTGVRTIVSLNESGHLR